MGVVGFTFTPLGRALARRLGGEHPADVKALQDEVDALRQDLADTRAELLHQLEDAHNRLDFAERMLAEVRQKPALPGGG
jgi:cell division FtsZ-interacting protein ZapD